MGLFRLLLAVSVVLAHAGGVHGIRPLGGEEAVETFFMISGFYMALILNEKYKGPGSYSLFLSNRLLRIFPTYWIVVAIAGGVWFIRSIYNPSNAGPMGLYSQHLGLGAMFLIHFSNLFIFGQDLVMFTGADSAGHLYLTAHFMQSHPPLFLYLICRPAWSLSIELTFYLMAPWIVRRGVKFLAMIVAGSLALRLYLHFGLNLTQDPWTFRFFPTEVAFFAAGAIAYHLMRGMEARKTPKSLIWSVALLVFIAFFLYQFVPVQTAGIKPWAFYLLAWPAIPCLSIVSGKSRFDRYIGELSYPLYLTHFPVLEFLDPLWIGKGWHHGEGVAVLVGGLIWSILLIHFIIRPMERLRQARVRKPISETATQPSRMFGTVAVGA